MLLNNKKDFSIKLVIINLLFYNRMKIKVNKCLWSFLNTLNGAENCTSHVYIVSEKGLKSDVHARL